MKLYSVTTILKPFNSFEGISKAVLNHAARRGTVVHSMCAWHSKGLPINDNWVSDEYMGYVKSYQAWFDAYVEEVIFSEVRLADETLGYYGHPDLYCRLVDDRFVLVDFKTPVTEQPVWKMQLSAYRNLVQVRRWVDCSMALKLNPTGRCATAIEYQYHDSDFAAFLSALNAYRYVNE